MRAIDYLSVFFLLGAAPAWQAGLDNFSAGLGSALLVILLIGAIRTTQSDTDVVDRIAPCSCPADPSRDQI